MRWNETCQKRASRLYETVHAAVKREVGLRANVLTIAKEAQKRGAVHFHYALGVESAAELRAAKAFRRHLERLSQKRRYSFGHVNGKFVRPRPAREAAAYLAWWSELETRIDVLWLGVHVEARLPHATKLRAILGASP
jgi:hypothetical protein